MVLKLQVDDVFINNLKEKLLEPNEEVIFRDAFTYLNWAANEIRRGREILSCDKNGGNIKILEMECFNKVKPK